MPQREIARSEVPAPGDVVVATMDGDTPTTFTLFLPAGWSVRPSGEAELSIHFHGTAWFAVQEHVRRGSMMPFASFNVPGSSDGFAAAFRDPGAFDRLLDGAAREMVARGAPVGTRIARVQLSSFSAGYAAVREILRHPSNVDRIERVVLADSLYAPDDPATAGTDVRRPDVSALQPFIDFARLAADGKKTFLATHSSVPPLRSITPWTNLETIARHIDPALVPAAVGDDTGPPEFPLVSRIDRGRFHVWRYGGDNTDAHLTHLRHVADFWIALDDAGE